MSDLTSTLTVPTSLRQRDVAADRVVSVEWYVWSAVLGLTSSTVGLYWDICWHMSIGRDSFWTPAHVAMQIGAMVACIFCGYLILHTTFSKDSSARETSVRIWGFRGPLGAFIAVWGLFLMLASFPFDNWWHSSFGVDVKILTPPHSGIVLGIFAVGFGSLVILTARRNLSSGGTNAKLNWLLLYLGALLFSLLSILFFQYIGDRTIMHSSVFYMVLGLIAPFVLVGINRASGQPWAATKAASIYMVLWMLGEWIMPLFPAHPRLGPVFTSVTHLVPMGFPVLMVPGGVAIDYLLQRFSHKGRFTQAFIVGTGFLAIMVAVQWPFSEFLISPYARNWFFGTNYFAFRERPTDYARAWQFAVVETSRVQLLVGMFLAWLVTVFSTRIGLLWGEWIRTIQR